MGAYTLSMVHLRVEEELEEKLEEKLEEELEEDVEGDTVAAVEDAKAEEEDRVAHYQEDHRHRQKPCHQLYSVERLKRRAMSPYCLDSLCKCGLLYFHPKYS